MNQALYAHMNNKRKMKKNRNFKSKNIIHFHVCTFWISVDAEKFSVSQKLSVVFKLLNDLLSVSLNFIL
jgi:hypothetical protein